jgi:hypothetical protein
MRDGMDVIDLSYTEDKKQPTGEGIGTRKLRAASR